MTAPTDPKMTRIQLGIELRRLREGADRSMYEAADVLGCKQPKISKIESGAQGVKPDEVAKLVDFYDAALEKRDYLVDLAENQPKRSRRKRYHRDTVPDWAQRYFTLEWEATEIKHYEVEIITGLLQIEEYARATFRAWEPAADPRIVDRQTKARMSRQTVLTRPERPLDFHVVLSEAALHRVQGGAAVMAEQLEHLLRASELPNVTLQVLPFTGDRIAVTSSISLLHLARHELSTVYLEDLFGATYLWDSGEYTRHSVVFERICAASLSVEATRRLIAKVARKYR